MRKYFVCLAAAAAATLIGPALAVAHPAAHARQSKQGIIVTSRHDQRVGFYIQRSHARATAHAASCPPGNFIPSYCSPPVEQSLFGAYAWNDGGVTFGSTNSSTCKALGWSSSPCGVYTAQANTLIVVFAGVDGRYGYGQSLTVSCSAPNGATCPTFHKVNSENGAQGDSEVWYADATSAISQAKPIFVTATAVNSNCGTHYSAPCDVSLQAVTFANAISGTTPPQSTGIGASSVCSSAKAAPSCSLTTTEPDSLVWAALNNPSAATIPTWPSNQFAVGVADGANQKTFYSQFLGTCTANANGSKPCTTMPLPASGLYQNPYVLAPTASLTNTKVTINDTAPTNDPFNEVVVEIL
ncbi:MAG: hypothetical protein ACLP0J_29350 [Solirubrobacteraceae bacterium]|jgi:hypothetical protein